MMGYSENKRRDEAAWAHVQKMRDQRNAEARSAWQSGPTKRELDMIQRHHAARRAAQSGACMTARITMAAFGLMVIVLKATIHEDRGNGCYDHPIDEFRPGPRTAGDHNGCTLEPDW